MKTIFLGMLLICYGLSASAAAKAAKTCTDFGISLEDCLGTSAGCADPIMCQEHWAPETLPKKIKGEAVAVEVQESSTLKGIGIDCISSAIQKKTGVVPSEGWLGFLAVGVQMAPDNGKRLRRTDADDIRRKLNIIALTQAYGFCSDQSDFKLGDSKRFLLGNELHTDPIRKWWRENGFQENSGYVTARQGWMVRDYASGKVNATMSANQEQEFESMLRQVYSVKQEAFTKLFKSDDMIKNYDGAGEIYDSLFSKFLNDGGSSHLLNPAGQSYDVMKSCLADIKTKQSDGRFLAGTRENKDLCLDMIKECGLDRAKHGGICTSRSEKYTPAPGSAPVPRREAPAGAAAADGKAKP